MVTNTSLNNNVLSLRLAGEYWREVCGASRRSARTSSPRTADTIDSESVEAANAHFEAVKSRLRRERAAAGTG